MGPRRSPNVHTPRPNSAPRAHDADALASVSLPSVSDMRALGYAHRRSAASTSTSRFVECFEPHGAKGEPETPATATSFSTFASTSTSIQEYCLPLHVAWHDAAHTASPPFSGYPYIVGEHDEQEEDVRRRRRRRSGALRRMHIRFGWRGLAGEGAGGGRSCRLRSLHLTSTSLRSGVMMPMAPHSLLTHTHTRA
ncbi:hypothetical protein DFH09DRAFT_210953 [Mycena vulgaris]|nr:hypothetical protein DFH09DRAFT_210953 [Mycena vulgaris]